nr:hypothetical protein [Iamia sp. SCSIO 61187]
MAGQAGGGGLLRRGLRRLRATEHLRLIFAELHAPAIRDTVSFPGAAAAFGPDGRPHDRAGTDAAAAVLLDQLTWWGLALRDARSARALV